MSDSGESSEQDVYEVEKILDRIIGDETLYRVRWKGYGSDGDTWEPRENLLSCEDLLNTYNAEHVEKPSVVEPEDRGVNTDQNPKQGEDHSTPDEDKPKNSQETAKKSFSGTRGRGRGRGKGLGRYRFTPKKRGVGRPKKVRSPSPSTTSDSSSENDSSSSEEPRVKDPFWDDLEKGKIDVLSSDLYSKVKRRRVPVERFHVSHEVTGKRGRGRKKASETQKSLIASTSSSNAEDLKSSEESNKNASAEERLMSVCEDPSPKNVEKEMTPERESDPSQSGLSSPVLDYLESQLHKQTDQPKPRAPLWPSSSNQSQMEKPAKLTDKQSDQDEEKCLEVDRKEEEETPKPKPKEKSGIFEEFGVLDSLSGGFSPSHQTGNNLQEKKFKILELSKEEMTAITSGENGASAPSQLKETRKEDVSNVTKTTEDYASSAESPPSETEVPPASDAFSLAIQGLDQLPSLSPRVKEKTRKWNRASLLLDASDEKSASDTQTSPTPSRSPTPAPASTPNPTPPASSVMSMFESFEQELEAAGGKAKELRPAEEEVTQVSEKQPRVEKQSPDANMNKILDSMSEFLKIKVNFTLDEITPKEIEQHHEAGEPPCRLERDFSNAEFRQFLRSNNYEMVYEILKSKKNLYNLEHQDSLWLTQIMFASLSGFNEIVRILAHHGAKVNALTKSNQTALMFAAEKGHEIAVRILLMYGAYVNLQTTTGETALYKACKYGHTEIVRCLLHAGADPSLKTSLGVTAATVDSRYAQASISTIKNHVKSVESTVESCIKSNLQQLGLCAHGPAVIPLRSYNVREQALIHFSFHCNVTDVPPNQGLMLFAVHGYIGNQLSVKCRMRGPCHVIAVSLNNAVMEPIMPVKQEEKYCHFMTNLIWRNGSNSLRLFLFQDGLTKEKIYVTAYVVGFARA